MPAQSRRPASRPSRAQRRSGASSARTYNVPERAAPSNARTYTVPERTAPAASTYVPRRSYAAGPPLLDHAAEYKFIRKDLIRILVWAGLITLMIIALSFVL
jgi:hypothetical protein